MSIFDFLLSGGETADSVQNNSDTLEELQQLLDETERNRITPQTRKSYNTKLRKFLEWYDNNIRSGDFEGPCPTRSELATRLQTEELEKVVMLYLTKRYCHDNLKAGSLQGDVSAFGFCVKEEGMQLPSLLKARLAKFLQCLSKQDARKREAGGPEVRVGRQPLSFGEYDKLCRKLLADEDIMSLLLVTITWSAMNRVNESLKLAFANIEKEDDHLKLTIQKTKSDQSGEKKKIVRVYANPSEPHLCVFTALGLFLLKYGVQEDAVFGGTSLESSRSKYCKIIQRITDTDRAGTHSLRKGAASFASGSSTNSPGVFSICNRGGWSTGVMNRYIRDDTSGDCYLGRILTGLNRDDADFATLPPHFTDELDPVDAFITETFGIECPLHSSAITLCLASVCWHKERLADISPGYATMIPSLPQPATGIRSLYIRGTGVPPDISLHCVIRDLKEQQDSTLEFLRTYRDETRTWRERLLGQVRDTIEKHWELNGTVTPHHMKEVIGASLENQLDILMSGVNKLLDDRLPARVVQTPTAPSVPTPSAGQFAFRPGVPGFSSLPVGFCLSPKWTLHQICYFYFRPQDYKGEPVPALREMDAGDFRFHPKRKEQTSILRDIKMVMSHVLNQLSSDCIEVLETGSMVEVRSIQIRIPPPPRSARRSRGTYNTNVLTVGVRCLRNRFGKVPPIRTSSRIQNSRRRRRG